MIDPITTFKDYEIQMMYHVCEAVGGLLENTLEGVEHEEPLAIEIIQEMDDFGDLYTCATHGHREYMVSLLTAFYDFCQSNDMDFDDVEQKQNAVTIVKCRQLLRKLIAVEPTTVH